MRPRSGVDVADPQEVRVAWRELGSSLSDLRRSAGLSQKALGEGVRYSRSSVANIEIGLQHVDRSFWEAADALLHAQGQLVRCYDDAEALQRAYRRGDHDSVITKRVVSSPNRLGNEC